MPIFSAPCSSSVSTWPSRRGMRAQRIELGVEVGEEAVRARAGAPPRPHITSSASSSISAIGSSSGSSARAIESACASVFPTSAKLVGSAMPCSSAIRCRSASDSPAVMPGERPPVEARQLPAHVVDERRLVGLHAGQRQREDEIGDVVGAVLRDREQKQREPASRVVVETAEQAEVEQREPAVVGAGGRCPRAGRRGRRLRSTIWWT